MENSDADVLDKRKSRRLGVCLDCVLETGGNLHPGQMRELSFGGAFVQTDLQLNRNTLVAVFIRSSGTDQPLEFKLTAEVVYAGRFLQGYDNFSGIGIRFLNLTLEESRQLHNLLDTLEEIPQKKYQIF